MTAFSRTLLKAASQQQQTALVLGVANHRSIAWSCALSLLQKNYNVIVTYQNERFKSRVESMVHQHNKEEEEGKGWTTKKTKLSCFECDVTSEESIKNLFGNHIHPLLESEERQQRHYPRLDAMVHSIAYAPSSAMKKGADDARGDETDSFSSSAPLPFLNTTKEDFDIAHNVSSYSLLLLARYALPYLSQSSSSTTATTTTASSSSKKIEEIEAAADDNNRSPSIISLTYLGSNRTVPNYNIMGPAKSSLESISRTLAYELGPPPHSIRVNCVSAGPISTLASRGIEGISNMREDVEKRSMLKRNITGKEVGDVVAFLCGKEASGITGQTIFVDGGYSAVAGPVQ